MHKRAAFWFACVLLLASFVGLFLSFPPLSILLIVLSVAAGLVLGRLLPERAGAKSSDGQTLSKPDDEAEEGLALGRLFEATMSGMREGLIVVDRDLRVVAANVAARRLFRPSLGRLESQSLTQLTRNPDINGAFVDALNGKERSGVKVETFGDGRSVFDLRVVPLSSSEHGYTEGALGVFFDITRLERLERVRQEFLSNVSHELKTPLTAILAFVETLETTPLEDEENTRRFLSIIRRNASRMHSLIDDILELSAIEAGTVKVEITRVELMPAVNEVNASLAAMAAARAIELRNEVPPEAFIYADRSRLEQMLTNLIENAIKFNREGGSVTVRLNDGERTRIIVEDTGEGIPAQHLERLFERFYRVDRARSREMGGTGLGLAIVKHLALAHGGEVSVESKLGEGSVFTIELPKLEGVESSRVVEDALIQTAIR